MKQEHPAPWHDATFFASTRAALLRSAGVDLADELSQNPESGCELICRHLLDGQLTPMDTKDGAFCLGHLGLGNGALVLRRLAHGHSALGVRAAAAAALQALRQAPAAAGHDCDTRDEIMARVYREQLLKKLDIGAMRARLKIQ